MNWITNYVRPRINSMLGRRPEVPENLWIKCPETGEMVFHKDLEDNKWVIPASGYHMKMPAKARLADLFDGRSQLLVQHFMFTPGWKEGCPSCSFMADHTDGMNNHLSHHDVTMIAVSRAPLADLERYRKRMGWRFKWVSSFGNDFNHDFSVSFTPDEVASGKIDYNFGEWPELGEEWPGISAFYKDDAGQVFRTYSTYGRGVEAMMGTYHLLDLAPKERNEAEGMDWLRRHDRYE